MAIEAKNPSSLTQCDQVGSSGAGPVPADQAKTAFQKRLGRYSEAKKRSSQVYNFLKHNEPTLAKTAEKMKTCGSQLIFRNFYKTGVFRLLSGITCDKHLLCPLCAIRRSARQYYKYKERFEFVKEKNPDLVLVMFTLTVKNRPDLLEAWDHLYESMKKLLQKRRNNKKGLTKSSLSLMDGAVWSYEVTNNGRGWHPHIHGLGLVPSGSDPAKIERQLKAEWEDITEDSHQCKVEFPHNQQDETKAFFEVFKYATKAGDLTVFQNVELFKTLEGRRFTASFGSLYGVVIDKDPISEELLQDYVDMMFRFNGNSYVHFDTDMEIIDLDQEKIDNAFVIRKKKLSSIENKNGEPLWQEKISNWMENKKILKAYSICSLTISKQLILESVQYVKDLLLSGAMIGPPIILKHVDDVGIRTVMVNENLKKRFKNERKQLCLPLEWNGREC